MPRSGASCLQKCGLDLHDSDEFALSVVRQASVLFNITLYQVHLLSLDERDAEHRLLYFQ